MPSNPTRIDGRRSETSFGLTTLCFSHCGGEGPCIHCSNGDTQKLPNTNDFFKWNVLYMQKLHVFVICPYGMDNIDGVGDIFGLSGPSMKI